MNSLKTAYGKPIRILAVDPASHSMAFALVERNGKDLKLVCAGKLKFPMPNDMQTKMYAISSVWPFLLEKLSPDHIVIEQSIYIQNPQTTRILAYLVGGVWSSSVSVGVPVSDVPPMTWKSWIGYKRIMPLEKKKLIEEMGEKEAKKFMSSERKTRVKNIIVPRIPQVEAINDYDIIDAIGIALWKASTYDI